MRTGLILSMAGKFMRSRSLALSTVVPFVTAAVLVGMFIAMKAFTLSGAQVADRDLGRFSSQLDLGTVSSLRPGDVGPAEVAAAAARSAGAADVVVSLTSFDVRPDLARSSLVLYFETDWSADPFPARYSLTQGRWPVRPGEVVLTRSLRQRVGPGETLSVLSGNERFQVVGVATDRFDSFARILAAQGTWRTFGEATRRNFSTVLATPTLQWNGEPQRVVAAVQAALAGTGSRKADLAQSLRTRAGELAQQRGSWIERIPLAYRIPSLALPLLSILTVFGLNNRRFRRSTRVLSSVGMSGWVAACGVALATVAWSMISTVAGGLLGVGLGAVARPICDQYLAGPIPPFPDVTAPLLQLLWVTPLACLVAGFTLAVGRRDAPRRRLGSPRAGRAVTRLRRLGAIVAGLGVAAQVATLDSVPGSMIMAGTLGVAVLLLTPELVSAAIRLIPTEDPRARLGRRQLAHDEDRAVAGVAVLAAVLGAPLGLLTLLATLVSTAEAERTPDVAPHQVVLSSPAGAFHPPSPDVVRAVTARVAFDEPAVQVGYLWTDTVKVTVQGSGIGTVLVVGSVAEAARLNNAPLPVDQARTLRDGGILVWDGDEQGRRALLVHDAETGRVLSTTDLLPAGRVDFQPPWDQSASGIIIASTAQRLGLEVKKAALVFTGASDAQAAAAKQATTEAGLDPYQVGTYEPPQPIRVPPAFYTAAIGLSLIVLVTTMAVARAQVLTLRGYLGRLISVGLSRRWVRQVLLLQSAVVVAMSTLLAMLMAVPPVVIAVVRLPDFALSIPWRWLGIVLVAFYCATAFATLVSSRGLRATDRLAV